MQGHGEHDTDGTDREPATAASRDALKNDNFEVAKLTLAQEGKVPDDATRGRRRRAEDRLPARRKSTRCARFLKKGGKLLLLLDPPDKADGAAARRT